MRKVVIWGIVLVCLTVLLAGSGATAQRARVTEAATTSRPTQVEVTNFPPVQAVSGAVNVANLPAVQTVSGSVNVGNLPAVQSVSGSVVVSNLPLDADGNLRVSTPTPTAAPSSLFVKVADALPISVAQFPGTVPYPVVGWKTVQVFFRATLPQQSQGCLQLNPEFGSGDMFATAPWNGPTLCGSVGQLTAPVGGGPIVDPELRFRLGGGGLSSTTIEAWLYLSN